MTRWIISPRADLGMLLVPLAFTLAAACLPQTPEEGLPLGAFLFLVVAFDVAHVWATLYFSYLDPAVRTRRRLLLWLPIPLTLAVVYRLHLHSPVLFWTLLAYWAIQHFASQQWGFVALYKLRAGERDPFDRYLDKWTLWAGCLGPVLWWHASPERAFDWFAAEEQFLFRLDPALKPELYALLAGVAAVYLGRQVQLAARGRFNWGKNLWMLASWASWSLGIGLPAHPLISLACVNLLHGIPFLVLTWFRVHERWERAGAEPGGLVAWLARPGRLWAFYGLILALALLEEGLWDRYLWGVYGMAGRVELSREATAAVVAVLATPQIVHYYLDAWLWKLDGTNPELEAVLRPDAPATDPGAPGAAS